MVKGSKAIKCKHCNAIIGYSIPTGEYAHGIPIYKETYTGADYKDTTPFPNKEIKVKHLICNKCRKEAQ